MSAQLDVLRQVLPRLEAAGFTCMVSGSIASSIHGIPRMTRDVDIVVALEPGDSRRFLAALGDPMLDWAYVERWAATLGDRLRAATRA